MIDYSCLFPTIATNPKSNRNIWRQKPTCLEENLYLKTCIFRSLHALGNFFCSANILTFLHEMCSNVYVLYINPWANSYYGQCGLIIIQLLPYALVDTSSLFIYFFFPINNSLVLIDWQVIDSLQWPGSPFWTSSVQFWISHSQFHWFVCFFFKFPGVRIHTNEREHP